MGDVTKLPYPATVEAMADLAVETTFQELGARGAFEESGGISQSAMIFGKACAMTAIQQLAAAACALEKGAAT